MIKEQPNYYAIIPAKVRYDTELPPNAKLLYGEITSLSIKDGYCWASNAYFAKLYNVNSSTISSWIAKLADKQYIFLEIEEKYKRKIYIEMSVTLPDFIGGGLRNSRRGVSEKAEGGVSEKAEDNNTSINNTRLIPAEDKPQESVSFNFKEEKEKLKNITSNKIRNLIIYNYLEFKQLSYTSKKEWNAAYREMMTWADKLTGYNSDQLDKAFRVVNEMSQYGQKFTWKLSTVVKEIPHIIKL